MAKKKEAVDHFKLLCDKTDRLAPIYANDSFWQTMKQACDAVRNDGPKQEAIAALDYESRHWPTNTSNSKAIKIVMDNIEAGVAQ